MQRKGVYFYTVFCAELESKQKDAAIVIQPANRVVGRFHCIGAQPWSSTTVYRQVGGSECVLMYFDGSELCKLSVACTNKICFGFVVLGMLSR